MLTNIGNKAVPTVIALLLIYVTWISAMDTPAMEQIDAGMNRALAVFAGARALNAAISLLQGTEVSVGFVAGVTLSVGQILDPVNDLVESFSNLMLVSSVAFGVQKVLLTIGQYEYVKIAMTAVLFTWGLVRVIKGMTPRWLNIALVLMLMARFAIPVATMGSDAVYSHFLQQDYTEGQKTLTTMTEELNKDADPGSLSSLDPRPIIERMKQVATSATNHVIKLIVVFLLQTLLVPVFLLWVMYTALRAVLAGGRST